MAVCLLSALAFLGVMRLPASGGSDDRTISFYNLNTKETLTVAYMKNGRHDSAAMKKINHILRDWRRDEAIRMDPDLIDLVYDVHRELGSKAPITVISGYRSPVTNGKLRSRSSGVAQQSQHMHGKAMDLHFPDVPLKRLREVALKFQSGGVGYYPSSGQPFVHVDTGRVRHWPRMTRQQLAALFPDGNTLHVPADGKPLARKVATSDIAVAATEARRPPRPQQVASAGPSDPSHPAAFADPARDVITGKRGSFQFSLFGKSDDDAEGQAENAAKSEKPSLLASLIPDANKARDMLTGRSSDFVPPPPALRPERKAEVSVAALANPPAPSPRPNHEAGIDTMTITASISATPELPRTTEKTPPPMVLASLGPLAAPAKQETATRREPVAPSNANASMGLGAFAPALRYDPVPVTPLIAAHSAAGPAFAELRAPDQIRISSLCIKPESSLAMSFGSDGLQAPHTAGFTGPAVLSLPVHRHAAPLRTAAMQH